MVMGQGTLMCMCVCGGGAAWHHAVCGLLQQQVPGGNSANLLQDSSSGRDVTVVLDVGNPPGRSWALGCVP